ncbi:polyprenyl synthetase family protein [Mycetocola tolaasinivorans]|uniref:Polyprenyl synthetase family protein n=1 Tax=Mycetocola tolaasinivorans TaxID=76635 RepID=A0A3L7ADF8_9MICO|nr:polyprenyl synthetase family protein [Mycetocola tolaasinivorans]RLP78014.1 polyprenyl synthetase family protein [Mycetocola tolaasinivorans]
MNPPIVHTLTRTLSPSPDIARDTGHARPDQGRESAEHCPSENTPNSQLTSPVAPEKPASPHSPQTTTSSLTPDVPVSESAGLPSAAIDAWVTHLIGQVEDSMSAILAAGRERSTGMDPSYPPLWDALGDALRGGKRVRPRLVLGAYLALRTGEDALAVPDSVILTAVAQELLHGAFVVHDDVIDGDLVRRGHPNVTGNLLASHPRRHSDPARARRDAEASAIIGGDLLLTAAQRQLALLDVPADVRVNLLDLFDEAVHVTAGGEHADVVLAALPPGTPPITRILTMTEHKTASYSFSVPLRSGAVLAGADRNLLRALDAVARALGLAFQLQDDHLGVFGESARTGKSITADLESGKNTALLSLARASDAWPLISALTTTPDAHTTTHWAGVQEALIRAGVRDRHHAVVTTALDRARSAVQDPALPPRLRAYLDAVIADLEERDV